MVQVKQWRFSKAQDCLIQWSFFNSCIGYCFLAWIDQEVCFLSLHNSKSSKQQAKAELQKRFPRAKLIENKPSSHMVTQIQKYFNGSDSLITVIVSGTDFQIKIWKVLCSIPKGTTVTYQWIAKKVNSPSAYRAVGSAVGANPVAFILPCHRVLPKNSGLGGFRCGVAIKKKLLQLEGVIVKSS